MASAATAIDWAALPSLGLQLGVDSDRAIGEALGCSHWAVRGRRRALGIEASYDKRKDGTQVDRSKAHCKYSDRQLRKMNEEAAETRWLEVQTQSGLQSSGGAWETYDGE
jgi:osmotically-inducible protein OsmY